jgi:hypothetical protein
LATTDSAGSQAASPISHHSHSFHTLFFHTPAQRA